MELELKGRVAIVTGAGKGLGRAYAEHLAGLGMKVVVNNRLRSGQPSSAEAVATAIRAAGGEAVANTESVEDEHGAARLVQAALAAYGRLDALVCNAGVSQHATLQKTALDEFRSVMNVNVYGTVYPVHAAWPHLREAGFGRIVLTTSGAGFFGVHGLTAYSASKGAVIAFGRALALEGASRNVFTNIVAPYAHTPMTDAHMTADHARRFPPQAVAPLVAWLVSPRCPSNGAAIVAAGGGFRRAEAVEGPLAMFPREALSAATIAARWEEIMRLEPAERRPDATASFAAIDAAVR